MLEKSQSLSGLRPWAAEVIPVVSGNRRPSIWRLLNDRSPTSKWPSIACDHRRLIAAMSGRTVDLGCRGGTERIRAKATALECTPGVFLYSITFEWTPRPWISACLAPHVALYHTSFLYPTLVWTNMFGTIRGIHPKPLDLVPQTH